ncbi:TIGR04086 family membrane protein [Crassaminicella profunda]|uniref:TIGR04086 family membrane protein n=1 Tax=Crassaminicella profunda TaxID=1286698 RepID=UPI001CA633D0|nr:TIGR04086 family membrane protein [Crassaminicella profunda]QZY57054.1 TIGR04086 family membrane protein [Crassaminicella profunda]
MKSNKNIEKSGSIIWVYVKAILAACIFALLIFIIMALLITYTNISETIIPMMASIVMVISTLISGMVVGAKTKRKGWLHGALVGVVYVLLIIFMNWVFVKDFSIGSPALLKSLIGIIAGGIGGMIGVNLK